MKNRALLILPAVLSLLLFPSGIRSAVAKVVGPPEVAWKDLDFKQKKAFMKTVVTPKMKPVLQAFDAKKFDTVNCETCHGKDAAERKYKMPSPDIKPLPNTSEKFQAKMKAEPTWPKWTKFMSEEVEPGVAKLLALAPYDPKKPDKDAFGCNRCHKLE